MWRCVVLSLFLFGGLAGCQAESGREEAVWLMPGAEGKADGSSVATAHLVSGTPIVFLVDCREWVTCDLDLEIGEVIPTTDGTGSPFSGTLASVEADGKPVGILYAGDVFREHLWHEDAGHEF